MEKCNRKKKGPGESKEKQKAKTEQSNNTRVAVYKVQKLANFLDQKCFRISKA